MSHRQSPIVALLVWLIATAALAGEWPQILGPHRSGHAENERLAESWLQGAPAARWDRKVGAGFAGVAVVAEKVILFHRHGDEQIVEAIEAASGKTLWKHTSPTRYVSSISDDNGPRCVPLVTGSRVVVFGAEGDLICLTLDKGAEIWRRDTHADFDVPESYFGAGSTPIAAGENVLVNVGGRKTGGLVAFSLADGKTVWQATDEQASYSSPILIKLEGKSQAIFVTRLQVVSVDPATGRERFRFLFGKRGPTVNAATPLVCGDRLFFTASYGIGAMMVKPAADRAEVAWQNDAMASQYSTAIYHDGHLYGVDGRADGGTTQLRCLDAKTGKVLWSQPDFGTANLIYADDKLLALKDDGTLVLAKVSKDGYRQLASAKILSSTTRALPALASGRLYVRDSDTLKCLDVGRQ
jgi:outer membrane protein assembly factor BamB